MIWVGKGPESERYLRLGMTRQSLMQHSECSLGPIKNKSI
jgi:hypothetical protein